MAVGTKVELSSTEILIHNYWLLNTGIGLVYQFKNDLNIFLLCDYSVGNRPVSQTQIDIYIDNKLYLIESIKTNGNYLGVYGGVNYPLMSMLTKVRRLSESLVSTK